MTKPQTYRLGVSCDLFALLAESDAKREANAPVTLTMPVLPEGEFDHPAYGKLDWSPKRFARMIANHEQKVTGFAPILNVDHATHNPFAVAVPAYGWVQSLSHVPGTGLMAEVELTDLGEEAIRCKRYRYLSGEVGEWSDSRGQKFEDVVIGLALTNTPFHDTMPGLFARDQVSGAWSFQATGAAGVPANAHDAPTRAAQETLMDVLKLLRRLFGLADSTSDEEVVLAAVRSAPEPHKPEPLVGVVATLADPNTVTLSRVELDKLRADAAEVAQFKAQAEASAKAAADAQTALLSREAASTVDAYIAAGKVLPAQRDTALQFAVSDPTLFRQMFEAARPQLDLTARGTVLKPGEGETQAPETFSGAVASVIAAEGLEYMEAIDRVARDHPALYEAHRKTGRAH